MLKRLATSRAGQPGWALCVLLWALFAACSSSDPATQNGQPDAAGTTMNCPAGQMNCGAGCVDVLANSASCGGCGKVCSADQLCDQGSCKSKAQGCSTGRLACSAGCVDPSSNASHCGTCDHACSTDSVCTNGTCACLAGKTSCGTSCVDLQSDLANCGSCGKVCSSGHSCVQGNCACPAGKSACADSCVDSTTDSANCGTCGHACGAGKTCSAGACVCPSGQALCGEACVDTQSSSANCGTCGTQCGLGQACKAGVCGSGGGGETNVDGCAGLALNVSISQVAAYQVVEIPLMKDGSEIAQAARNTDIVIGRDAMIRVFVNVEAGFAARPLSARMFVQNGTSVDTYYSKKTISASSQPGNLDSTFQITVPKDKITPDSRYAVEVVECGTPGAGAMQRPRFPAMDGVPLGARATGGLKVKLIPLIARSMQADTSDTALQVYRSLLLAMYPVTEVELTVGTSLTVPSDTDWTAMLDQIRAKRQADAPAADIYYYGLLKPTTTLRAYCGSGCTAGIGYVPQGTGNQQASQRAALGLAFADAGSAETMAHEVGHNHGRNHAPCVQGGTISGVDSKYPYAGALLGVYGWDSRTSKLVAPDRTDIMGYCNNKWISDYTYDGLVNRVAQVNGAKSVLLDQASLRPWRVLLLDSRGPRWGFPIDEPSPPAGEPEIAEVLDAAGQAIEQVTVYRTMISDIDAFSIQVPTPEPGWQAIRVAGATPLAF